MELMVVAISSCEGFDGSVGNCNKLNQIRTHTIYSYLKVTIINFCVFCEQVKITKFYTLNMCLRSKMNEARAKILYNPQAIEVEGV